MGGKSVMGSFVSAHEMPTGISTTQGCISVGPSRLRASKGKQIEQRRS